MCPRPFDIRYYLLFQILRKIQTRVTQHTKDIDTSVVGREMKVDNKQGTPLLEDLLLTLL